MHKNGTPPKKLWLRSAIAVGVTFVGLGALASSALFTDAGTVSSNAFTDGTVVLGLTPVTTALTAANMAPGDTSYGTIKVTNNGTLPMRYAATSVATNADAKGLAAQAQMTINVGATTCDAAAFASGTSVHSAGPLGTTPASMAVFGDPATGLQTGDRALAAGANETLCVRVALPLSTGNAFQAATTTATFSFSAEQTTNN
ncbi:MAG: TasA family protein [Actinomycetes bacterium]